jgi:pimeloyl-ACP methyl ester carboxylesterase
MSAQVETFVGHDGLLLAVERSAGVRALSAQAAQTPNPALLFAHGFGQNRLSWRASAARLAALGYECLSLDARGHGDSAWSAAGGYELDDFVWDLMALAKAQAAPPILIGASMGGLVALLAQAEAALFRAIVLVDVTPRWESAGVGRIFEFMSAHPHGFATLQEAAQAVSSYLPHRDQKDPERLRGHLRLGADQRLRWHWDPKLLEHIPKATERYIPRLEAAAARVQCPVLLLSGGKSDVVSVATIASFQRLVPHAEHTQITDATHMIVGDRNDQFTEAIERYVSRV